MSLTIGSQVGPHKVTAMLGKGGMGVVFRARDTKLQRDVALKLLPDHFADDPERLARFRREAQVLASLNHPNIAQIYGLEDSTHQPCIVMELVEGETLAQRLKRDAIPLAETFVIAKQIADAVEAAHEKGIVHRDLKPANIKITPEGQVKVLDFGLAKAFEQPSAELLSESPTLTGGTLGGEILGTAAYMSPEQARGQQAQRTSDVWAFGCVLYEMLTGQKAFDGDSVTDILGSVLKLEPDWIALPKQTPDGIRKLLHRCLQKERKNRLHDIADARIEIEEAMAGSEIVSAELKRTSSRWTWVVAAVAVIATSVAAFGLLFRGTPDDAPEQRVEINTPPTTRNDLDSFAISPDGRKLVFTAADDKSRLWLRSLDSVQASPLAGTEYATYPFWSPNSQSIGFFAASFLKRVDLTGGPVQTLTEAVVGGGLSGAWSPNGVIVFNGAPGNPLYRVSDKGQNRAEATRIDLPRQLIQTRPVFLPDGVHFLLFVLGGPEARGVYIGSTTSTEIRRLFDAESPVVFMPPDHVLYIQQETLLARRFDPRTLELTGEPAPIAQRVAAVSASPAGVIAYRSRPAVDPKPIQMSWLDRSGKTVTSPSPGRLLSPEVSPDGTRLVFYRGSGAGDYDIWLLDIATGRTNRLTFDPGVKGFPEWSPDGTRVVFISNSGKELHIKLASGVGAEETLWKSPEVTSPSDWSPDGRYILIQNGLVFQRDIYALPVSGNKVDGQPIPIVTSAPFDERDAKFSPDGHWIAYQSNETGRFEIYIVPFPSLDTKLTVSKGGGREVRWRRDGKEIFFLSLDDKLMSVPITPAANGKTLNVGAPSVLFSSNHLALEPSPDINGQSYAVWPDGKRFLMYSGALEQINSPITLIQHWKPPLK